MPLNNSSGPLLIVGWDSASFDILQAFEAELTTLQNIKNQGAFGNLRTVYPPGTIPGWPCITTGMNPGKINTQRLAPFRNDEFQPNTGEENIEIWDVVNHFGGTTCVVNIPTVVEAYDMEGAMVAGFLSTGESTTVTPAGLLETLDIDFELRLPWEDVDREEDIFTAAMETAEKRFALVEALMDRYDWDFFIVNFDAPDRIGHSRLKYIDENHPFYTEKGRKKYGDDLRRAYIRLDDMLDELVDNAGNVFVISDHGMTPCHYRFHINDWLIDHSYLALEGDTGHATPSIPTRLVGYAKGAVTRYGLIDYIPKSLKRKSVVDRVDQTRHIAEADVDWEQTTAYMSAVYGGIDVIADDTAYVKSRITRDLESMEQPSLSVIDSRELYHGPNIDNVPDLFLDFDDPVLPTNQIGASSLLEPSSTGGMHSMEGILVAAGDGIRTVGEINDSTVMDITPTALHLMGLPIPSEVDGTVLDILTVDREPEKQEIDIDLDKGRDVLSEEEKDEIMDTLEDIGYM